MTRAVVTDGLYHYTDDKISVAWRIEGEKITWAAPMVWWAINDARGRAKKPSSDGYTWRRWQLLAERIDQPMKIKLELTMQKEDGPRADREEVIQCLLEELAVEIFDVETEEGECAVYSVGDAKVIE
jgi:hypothetical protein